MCKSSREKNKILVFRGPPTCVVFDPGGPSVKGANQENKTKRKFIDVY